MMADRRRVATYAVGIEGDQVVVAMRVREGDAVDVPDTSLTPVESRE